MGGGTLSSVRAYNTTEEIITGDAYDFRPRETSVFPFLPPEFSDLNQSQFLDLASWSQEEQYETEPVDVQYTAGTDGPSRSVSATNARPR